MLEKVDVKLNCDFFENRQELENIAKKIVFTGQIDKFYNYQFGELEYRSLKFETEILNEENYQGNAVVNYTEYEIPYTRIIEHKHFEREKEPYYPINNEKNEKLYEKYLNLSKKDKNVIFGGRLGQYKYYDMDKVILEALNCVKKEL